MKVYRDRDGYEIICHPNREQPYTVWKNGIVIAFTVTLHGAEKRIQEMQKGA